MKEGIRDQSYSGILRYFFPEFITALVLYTLVGLIDAKFIATLKSTAFYATVSITNTMIIFITKIAEGLSVGAVILCGQYQGRQDYPMVGRAALATLGATAVVGFCIATFLYRYASWIFELLCVPDSMMQAGVPFLRTRAFGIFFMFLFLGIVGFLRGVKNTRVTMYLFLLGSLVFILFDYALIFGAWGFPALGLQGSAYAFTIQYGVMFTAALAYMLCNPAYRIYQFSYKHIAWQQIRSLCALSWPVMFDKAALQMERIWMIRLLAPLGGSVLGALGAIKDMEALAFVPAVAFGQVVTLLVSNEFGAGDFAALKVTIKRCLAMATGMVFALLALFMLNATAIIGLFDRQQAFTDFACRAFPVVGILVFFDLLQLILAGALRGSSQVRLVMWTRVLSCLILFIPLSYGFSLLPVESTVIRFVLIYGSFNLVNGLSSLVYIYWFKSGLWKRKGSHG